MEQIKALGWPAAPISDRASTFGWVRWKKLAEKAGLRPIFGVELAVTDSIHAKRPTADHWAFFARDGVESVNALVELATSQFRYEPLLTYEQANAANGVLKIVGHRSNLELVLNDGQTFVALSATASRGYLAQALERGLPLIASGDNRYPSPAHEALFEIICGSGDQTYDRHILSADDWEHSVAGRVPQEQIAAAKGVMQSWLADDGWAKLQPAKLLAPERPATLREMCEVGAAKLGCDLTDPVYAERLERELRLIEEKQFADYFYILADLVQWARERMIVGPARGSSCGSLVCYLLQITTIDPLPRGLLFERFIDVNRSDLPDVDVDFSDAKRQLVFDYISAKYGAERVARLGTVAMYQPRSAVSEAGAALGVPKWKCEAALDSLIERSSGDSRALQTLEDTFNTTPSGQSLIKDHPEIMIAAKMEGHPRHSSSHAAGIVITEDPVRRYVAVDARNGVAQCDKKDAEELNLLKIDALGLTQLSVFEDALELAGLDRLFLETLPLDDQDAFDVLNKGHFAGIFQFNGLALQGLVEQFTVNDIEDIISVTALARPGPLTSGGASTWVKRKRGDQPIEYPHPAFEPYLKTTMGVVMYQESILQIGREIGDLSWGEVTELRKAMSKSLGKEYFDRFGNKFKAGAVAKGIPLELTTKIWDDLCAYGAWCVSGETRLKNPFRNQFDDTQEFTIKELYERNGLTTSRTGRRQKLFMWDGKGLKPTAIVDVIYSGVKTTYTLRTASGKQIRATSDHQFLQPDGSYARLGDLQVGGSVMVEGDWQPTERHVPTGTGSGRHNWRQQEIEGKPFYNGKRGNRAKVIAEHHVCQRCGVNPSQEVHHKDGDHTNHELSNLEAVCRKCHKLYHREMGVVPVAWQKGRGIVEDEVVSIELFGEEDVYDISMPPPHHNFLAEGIVVHNCFNRSHSVAYGIISYWCCWLKAHYPLEFAAATLSHMKTVEAQIQLLRELDAEGIGYVPADIEFSTDKWTVGSMNGVKRLVGPVSNVKGIGPKLSQQIMSSRARGEPLPAKAEKLLTYPKTPLDSLWPIRDAFARVMPNPRERNIFSDPVSIANIEATGVKQHDVMVFVILRKINPRDENEVINVAKRGYRVRGPQTSLNLQIADDTGVMFAKINRFDYETIGKQIVDRGAPGRCLYAMKGEVPGDFRMLAVKQVRFIGMIDEEAAEMLDGIEHAEQEAAE